MNIQCVLVKECIIKVSHKGQWVWLACRAVSMPN